MSSNQLALLSLVVALVAVGIASIGRPSAAVAPPPLQLESTELDESLRTLTGRLDAVEDAILDLQLETPGLATDSRQEAGESGDPVSGLGSRLREIERRLTAAEAAGGADDGAEQTSRARTWTVRGGRGPDEWIEVAQSFEATTEEMLDALRELRFQRLADGTDARLPVMDEMIALAQRSENGDVRADVWRQMDGVVDPAFATALLDALANDPHAKAREEAAESLSPFLPDPGVESALRAAAEFDEDEGVRAQALRSLSGSKRAR